MTTASVNQQEILRPGLLDLPGEIRNKIYAYLLAFPNGILCYNSQYRSHRGNKDLNQLQYVCRQLYQETNRLEVKVNPTIHFHTVKLLVKPSEFATADAIARFTDFVTRFPPTQLSWLRTVVLSNSFSDTRLGLQTLADETLPLLQQLGDTCRRLPNTTVYYKFENWSWFHLPLGKIIEQGICLSYTLRNDPLLALWCHSDDFHDSMIEMLTPRAAWSKVDGFPISDATLRRRARTLTWLGAENLRFLPVEDASSRAQFEPLLSQRIGMWSVEATTQGLVPVWLEAVRKWFEYGF